MKLTLLEEKKQPLLSRKEIVYSLEYPLASTPSKGEVIKLLVGQLKVDENLLVLDGIQPVYGDSRAKVSVAVYDTKEALEKFAIIHKKKAKKAEEKKEAKPAEQPKVEPKVEEKKEEKVEEKKEDGKETSKE